MISWIDFRDFFEINTGLYGASQAPLPPTDTIVALMTIARASHEVADENDARRQLEERRKVA